MSCVLSSKAATSSRMVEGDSQEKIKQENNIQEKDIDIIDSGTMSSELADWQVS